MSREEAIEILKDLWRTKHSTYLEADIRKALVMAIQALEQEPAHWTVDFTCSNCGCKCYPMDIDFGNYNYCPNCGREMEEGD